MVGEEKSQWLLGYEEHLLGLRLFFFLSSDNADSSAVEIYPK